MPRDLTVCDNNELKFKDPLSGEELVFYYRTPQTTDRVGYQKDLVVRVGNKIFTRVHEAALKHGAAILTGIRTGDFLVMRDNEKIALSSTPGDPGYREDWKDVLKTVAGDLLMILGRHVFEGPPSLQPVDPVILAAPNEELPPGAQDEIPPLGNEEAGAAAVPL